MKTLVRIQQQSDPRNNLNFMTAQILIKPYKDSDTIDVIGHISFQQNQGTDNWYALKFNVETDKPSHLVKMANLAKHIQKNTEWDSQPDEIFKVIGAVEYAVFNHQWVPVSKDGENLYNVYTSAGILYSTVVAPDEKTAKNILKKRKVAPVEVVLLSKITL
jgi:hypothetical protein